MIKQLDDNHIGIQILSQPRYLCVVRSAVETAARQYGFDEVVCGRIMLAVDEAVTNVIRHGYKGASDGAIAVCLAPVKKEGREGIRIVIHDESQGVDLALIKSRPTDEIRPGGLGVHILHEIMDEVTYAHHESGQGICLTMFKFTN